MSGRFKRTRDEEEEEMVLGKRFRGLTAEGEELLHLLDDADLDCRNLDSEDAVTGVMRSLEEEIGVTTNFPAEDCSSAVDVGISGSEVDLGYLLEASDDELGIPPTIDNSVVSDEDSGYLEHPGIENRREDYGNLWQFEEQADSDYGFLESEFDVDKFNNETEGERSFVNTAAAASSCMLFEHGDVDQNWRREAAACGM